MSENFLDAKIRMISIIHKKKKIPVICSRNILTKPSIAHFSSFNLLADVWEGALMRYMWSISRASWLLYTPVEYSFKNSYLC